jgi:hypothetical protein
MADFKTHLSFGSFLGFFLAIATYLADWVHTVYMAVIIYFATIIGSFMPDTDSDSGHPVKILFEFYAYFAAAITFYYVHDNGMDIVLKIVAPIAVFFFVKIILMKIFKKWTHHRGIFHSIPAALIAFFLTLLISWTTDLPLLEKFSISLAIFVGYFGHLLLDEIYSVKLVSNSSQNSDKKRSFKEIIKRNFGLKKSFGTALDFGFNNKSKLPAIIAYFILLVLIVVDFQVISKIFRYFTS